MLDLNNGKIAGIDSDGLHLLSYEASEALEKKNLSPSLVTAMESCPARWLTEQYIVPELDPTPPEAATRGSAFHKVMEVFYSRPQSERTRAALKEDMKSVVSSGEFKDFFRDKSQTSWLLDAVKGYYATVDTDPSEDEVASIEVRDGVTKDGLEIFVKGHLGDTKRSILGFVDRIIVDENNSDHVKVEDYKTGSRAKQWNPKTKGDEGLAEARQQTIYTMLLEKQGVKVSRSSLIFPIAGKVVDVNIHDENLRKISIESVEAADKRFDELIETKTFDFVPSFLCSWCPLVKICPEAQTNFRSEKMSNAYHSQPDTSELMKVIE